MLGRLLQLAGENVTIILVSDHGFKSGKNRPFVVPNTPTGIAAWHRPSGILVMRGNGLREDELIHGANLLDITPTILSLFGLPTARDMDGRVLLEAFSETCECCNGRGLLIFMDGVDHGGSGHRGRSDGAGRSAADARNPAPIAALLSGEEARIARAFFWPRWSLC